MKKKTPPELKKVAAKLKKRSDLPASSDASAAGSRAGAPLKLTEDPRFAQAVQNYEAGLKALQAHKYDKAKAFLRRLSTGASPALPTVPAST